LGNAFQHKNLPAKLLPEQDYLLTFKWTNLKSANKERRKIRLKEEG
jgi:hypothetical protein